MLISIIVALSENNVVGVNNQLPWKLSADLKRVKG
ncbi:MAG TPA: dihydrofolate reductase, partial [Bacteroidia bacterium]|nr:dihydrofolate reductase [Bacteroidia bacterium]